MIVWLVEIENAGSGDNYNIGMLSGNLKWCSSPYSGYFDKFIDQKTISPIQSACNITRGGALGGFIGSPSIEAYSSFLVDEIILKSIRLVGCKITIKVSVTEDGDSVASVFQRFVGTISDSKIINEKIISFSCKTEGAFDSKKFTSISVSKEMALNDPKNKAVGADVTIALGQNVDFPVVHVPLDGIAIAAAFVDSFALYDVKAIKIGGVVSLQTDFNTVSNERKGATLFAVYKMHYVDEETNIKVMLSFNGEPLFTASAEAYIENISKLFSGLQLKVVRGTGSGQSYTISGATWETLTSDDVEGVWFELNSTQDGALKETGIYSSAFSYVGDPATKQLLIKNDWLDSTSLGNPKSHLFRAPYTGTLAVIDESISFVSITESSNVFIVESGFNVGDSTIIGISESGDSIEEVLISADSISVIYETDSWKMIKVSLSNTTQDEGSSISIRTFERNDMVFHVPSGVSVSANAIGLTRPDTVPAADERATDIVSDGLSSNSYSSGNVFHLTGEVDALFNNLFFYEIEDFVNGSNISDGNSSLALLPHVDFRWETNTKPLIPSVGITATLTLNMFVVGEGNFALSHAVKDAVIKKEIVAEISPDITISINVPNRSIDFILTNAFGYSYTDIDYDAFNSIANQCDISDSLTVLSSKQIRGIVINLRGKIAIDGTEIYADTTVSKSLLGIYSSQKRKISKDKIYLRSTRSNVVGVSSFNCSTPAGIANYLCNLSGMTVDASLVSTHLKQWSFFSGGTGSDTDCQYHVSQNESVSDVISELCKQSMMAIWQGADGNVYSRWFADDDADTPTVKTFTDILQGSLSIDKPYHAYMSTDFKFKVKGKPYENQQTVGINTGIEGITSFPLPGDMDPTGPIIQNGVDGITLGSASVSINKTCQIFVSNTSGSIIDLFKRFPYGTTWVLKGEYSTDPGVIVSITARVTGVAINPYSVIYVAFSDMSEDFGAFFEIASMQGYGPGLSWTELVSGNFISDYTVAKNAWDHAYSAREFIGVEKMMSFEYTTLKQSPWGSDSAAIAKWLLYTVLHNTREKNIIRFRTKILPSTGFVGLMDYVRFQFGPYKIINGTSQSGVVGWIIEIQDIPESSSVSFTILTSISDSDALIIDERFADASLLIDERPVSNDYYDEGSLA